MLPRGFIILNIIRCCSVIALAMSIIAASVSLVKSFVATKFYFFDAINSVFISCACVVFIMSEISLFPGYFGKRWPLLGPESSLVTIGVAEVVVGFFLLGNLNESATSKENLGYAFNTLLTSAGIIVSFVGVVNFIASYVYCDSLTHTTARTVRSRRLAEGAAQKRSQRSPLQDIERSPQIALPARTYSARSLASTRSQTSLRSLDLAKSLERSNTSSSITRGPDPHPPRPTSSWYSRPSVTNRE